MTRKPRVRCRECAFYDDDMIQCERGFVVFYTQRIVTASRHCAAFQAVPLLSPCIVAAMEQAAELRRVRGRLDS